MENALCGARIGLGVVTAQLEIGLKRHFRRLALPVGSTEFSEKLSFRHSDRFPVLAVAQRRHSSWLNLSDGPPLRSRADDATFEICVAKLRKNRRAALWRAAYGAAPSKTRCVGDERVGERARGFSRPGASLRLSQSSKCRNPKRPALRLLRKDE